MFELLGFTTHDEKSVLLPTHQLILLGFLLNSIDMTISLSPERVKKLKTAYIKLMGKENPTIQDVAHVVGLMVASFPGNTFGPLFYRALDTLKTEALRTNKGSFAAKVQIPSYVLNDLQWWVDNIEHIRRPISHGTPCYIMQTDASTLGWGAHLQGKRTGEQWTEEEAKAHINCLEMKAALLALQSFSTTLSGTHVRLELDNTTAVSYINCMGGSRSKECNTLARQIWLWCIENQIWVSATHIPRYTETWSVGVVIKYLSNMEPTAELTMENLTKKLTMLLALLSGHRTQTLTKLNIDFMALTSA